MRLSPDYPAARAAFIAAATAAGARQASYPHPLQGPAGEALSVDVAELGPADAEHVVLVTSATHGVEGYCGSALQTEWLTNHLADRPETRITVTFLLDANGKFLMGIGTTPGCTDQRAYTFTAVRKMMAEHSAEVFTERAARAAARAAEYAAQRAERDAIESARRERFVALVRKAAQVGIEIGQNRDRDEVTIGFDDFDHLLDVIASAVDMGAVT